MLFCSKKNSKTICKRMIGPLEKTIVLTDFETRIVSSLQMYIPLKSLNDFTAFLDTFLKQEGCSTEDIDVVTLWLRLCMHRDSILLSEFVTVIFFSLLRNMIIVVGGGLSGLFIANQLKLKAKQVVVFALPYFR